MLTMIGKPVRKHELVSVDQSAAGVENVRDVLVMAPARGADRFCRLCIGAHQRVLIGKYSGSEVKLDGKDHIILREDDILAILEK